MTSKAGLFGIFLISLLIFENSSWANTIKLLGISGAKNENFSRISLEFSQIPEFKMEDHGQRFIIRLPGISFDPLFKESVSDEAIFQIKTSESVHESIVELFFRQMPKFVDVNVDRENVRLHVNIFWDQKRLGGRPAILDHKLGRHKASSEGNIAQKVISSKYSGHWNDFFQDFEWPVRFSLPLNFVFPRFPTPLALNNSELLPKNLLQEGSLIFCDQVAKKSGNFNNEKIQFSAIDFHHLIYAECLLRQKNDRQALDRLKKLDDQLSMHSLRGWKAYYQSYAMANSGHYYQAKNNLRSFGENNGDENPAFPWQRLLQAEIELTQQRPEKVLELLGTETKFHHQLDWQYSLRRADAFYQMGLYDDAYLIYQPLVSELRLLQEHAHSLANWCDVLYRKEEYSEAYRYYYLLSEVLKKPFTTQRPLADYRAAVAMMKSGDHVRARLMLWEIVKRHAGTEAGFQGWLKLIDMDILEDPKPNISRILSEYEEIVNLAPSRKLREEAFFKQILACHLTGQDLRAVKLLGRFFEEYWAGELLAEGQALFVEIFPGVIKKLVAHDTSFLALTLVSKHRLLLAQAHITYDFLLDLAKSYFQAGFLQQAETTYHFMMDFEKNQESKSKVFLPLIKVLYEQKKYEDVKKFASRYLKRYPEGNDKDRVLYYYADVLLKTGDVGTAVNLLVDKNRPQTIDLDSLAGNMFFEMGQYDLVEYYLSRVADTSVKDSPPDLILKRAEAFFFSQNWKKAIPLYEFLLDDSHFRGQAGYRLIQIYKEEGQSERALKLYRKLSETELENHWLKLAAETVQTGNSIQMGN